MNEMEMQLSRLFNAAVGEPPNQVTAHAARSQALKRRIITCVSATAALALAGSIGLAVAAHATARHAPATRNSQVSEPKYFVEQGFRPPGGFGQTQMAVRSTSTLAVTGHLACPGPFPYVAGESFAAARDHVFFLECQVLVHLGHKGTRFRQTGTRIYRFQLTSSGRVTGFRLIPGGNLPGLHEFELAASPDGSEVAVDLTKLQTPEPFEVLVINTSTGRRATWHVRKLPSGATFQPWSLSFARNGRELAIFGGNKCDKGFPNKCHAPNMEMIAVSSPARGGLLSSGRKIFTDGQVLKPTDGFVVNAVISPDGSTVMVSIDSKAGGRIIQISAATGRILRTLLRPVKPVLSFWIEGSDPTGRLVLVIGVDTRSRRDVIDWLAPGGRLRSLRPPGLNVTRAAW